uniref:Protein kinase domain-containing protein n=1 Tax=Macrostomum lignano TaxID=282301 RepID=A0A1I8I3N3_9PLAT
VEGPCFPGLSLRAGINWALPYTFVNGHSFLQGGMTWRSSAVSVRQLNRHYVTKATGAYVKCLVLNQAVWEVTAASSLRHPAILTMMAIFERVGLGSLFHHLHVRHQPLNDATRYAYLRQIGEALAFLHSRGVVHTALSSHAVHLVSPSLAKLGCLEYAVCTADTGPRCSYASLNDCYRAVANWLAPELLNRLPATAAADVYGLGVVAWEMWTAQVPHETAQSAADIRRRLSQRSSDWLSRWRDRRLPESLQQLVLSAVLPEPHRRPPLDTVCRLLVYGYWGAQRDGDDRFGDNLARRVRRSSPAACAAAAAEASTSAGARSHRQRSNSRSQRRQQPNRVSQDLTNVSSLATEILMASDNEDEQSDESDGEAAGAAAAGITLAARDYLELAAVPPPDRRSWSPGGRSRSPSNGNWAGRRGCRRRHHSCSSASAVGDGAGFKPAGHRTSFDPPCAERCSESPDLIRAASSGGFSSVAADCRRRRQPRAASADSGRPPLPPTARTIVNRLLSHVDRLSVMYRLLSHVDRLLIHVDRLLIHVDRLLTHVDRLLTRVDRLLTHVDRLLSHVDRLLIHVDRLLIHVDRLLIHVDRLLTHVDRLLIHVDRLLSHVDRLLIHVDRLLIHVDRLLIHVDRLLTHTGCSSFAGLIWGRKQMEANLAWTTRKLGRRSEPFAAAGPASPRRPRRSVNRLINQFEHIADSGHVSAASSVAATAGVLDSTPVKARPGDPVPTTCRVLLPNSQSARRALNLGERLGGRLLLIHSQHQQPQRHVAFLRQPQPTSNTKSPTPPISPVVESSPIAFGQARRSWLAAETRREARQVQEREWEAARWRNRRSALGDSGVGLSEVEPTMSEACEMPISQQQRQADSVPVPVVKRKGFGSSGSASNSIQPQDQGSWDSHVEQRHQGFGFATSSIGRTEDAPVPVQVKLKGLLSNSVQVQQEEQQCGGSWDSPVEQRHQGFGSARSSAVEQREAPVPVRMKQKGFFSNSSVQMEQNGGSWDSPVEKRHQGFGSAASSAGEQQQGCTEEVAVPVQVKRKGFSSNSVQVQQGEQQQQDEEEGRGSWESPAEKHLSASAGLQVKRKGFGNNMSSASAGNIDQQRDVVWAPVPVSQSTDETATTVSKRRRFGNSGQQRQQQPRRKGFGFGSSQPQTVQQEQDENCGEHQIDQQSADGHSSGGWKLQRGFGFNNRLPDDVEIPVQQTQQADEDNWETPEPQKQPTAECWESAVPVTVHSTADAQVTAPVSQTAQVGFGNSASNQAQVGFGNSATTQAQVGFGNSASNQAQVGFGSSANTQAQVGFGNSNTQAQVEFGNSNTQAQVGFGNSASNQAQVGFGNSASNQAQVGFGNLNTQAQMGFGNSANTQAQVGFGNSNTQAQVGFGNSANTQAQVGFGNSNTQAQVGFGNSNTQAQVGFGNSNTQAQVGFGSDVVTDCEDPIETDSINEVSQQPQQQQFSDWSELEASHFWPDDSDGDIAESPSAERRGWLAAFTDRVSGLLRRSVGYSDSATSADWSASPASRSNGRINIGIGHRHQFD